jgi:ADP-ribose pyrophosphatase YjhB (NUDIX family)
MTRVMMAHSPEQVEPQWILWAREIRAIAQTGLHYSKDANHSDLNPVFDQQRYSRLLELSADIIANHCDISKYSLLQSFNKENGYITPKIDVRAAIFDNQRILLVQDRTEGSWSMPGGWADINKLPSKMVEREVLEESGIITKAIKIIGIYEANRDREPISIFHAYKIIFLCDKLGGDPRGSEGTSAVQFFSIDALPELTGPRTNSKHVMEAYQHHINPGRPTFFE